MKKILVMALICLLGRFLHRVLQAESETDPAAPSRQAKEQPKVEKVQEPAPVKKPQLSEEEFFLPKSLDEINKERPLQIINFDYDKFSIREDAKPSSKPTPPG